MHTKYVIPPSDLFPNVVPSGRLDYEVCQKVYHYYYFYNQGWLRRAKGSG